MNSRIIRGGTLMPAKDGARTLAIERDPRVTLSSLLVRGVGKRLFQLCGAGYSLTNLHSQSLFSGWRLSECGQYQVVKGASRVRSIQVTEADESTELLLVEVGDF